MANANNIATLSDDLSLTLSGISELGDVLSTAINDGGHAIHPWACCLVFKLLAQYAQLQLDKIHDLARAIPEVSDAQS
jgi:hypothetical protein